MSRPPRRTEFRLIADLFAPLAADYDLAFGLTDDAAVVRPSPGCDLVVTADALVAGVHFRPDDDPDLIARKALRVNLSDIAAMGASPLGYLLTLARPEAVDDAWIEKFVVGLGHDQRAFGTILIGGDSVATEGPLALSVTAFGEVAQGRALRRSGAREGDIVYLSGTLGDAALGLRAMGGGLAALSADQRAELIDRYLLPRPRLLLGARLIGLASAVIDVSDGLVADLGHVCESSGAGATVEAAALPLSGAAQAALATDSEVLRTVLTGGDDYELLFCAAPESVDAIASLAVDLALPLTAIGWISAGAGVAVVDERGAAMDLPSGGYAHF